MLILEAPVTVDDEFAKLLMSDMNPDNFRRDDKAKIHTCDAVTGIKLYGFDTVVSVQEADIFSTILKTIDRQEYYPEDDGDDLFRIMANNSEASSHISNCSLDEPNTHEAMNGFPKI